MQKDSLEQEILWYMDSHCRSPNNTIQTLKIAQGLGKKTKKEINKYLYQLQKKGLIKKVIESPPTWQLLRHHQQSVSAPATQPVVNHTPGPLPVANPVLGLHPSSRPQPMASFASPSQQSTLPFVDNASTSVKLPPAPHEILAAETRPKSVFRDFATGSTMTQSARDAQWQSTYEFVPPQSPRSLLRDMSSNFSAISLKDKTLIDAELEKKVLKILSNNDKYMIEEVVRKIPGYEINAVTKALTSLLAKNSVQKVGDLYSLPLLNVATNMTLLPKMILEEDMCYTNNEFFSAVDFTADSFDITSFVSAPYSLAPSPAPILAPPSATPEPLRLPDGKNAISVLNEFAQSKQWTINYKECISGPDHKRRFSMTVELGGQSFHGPDAPTKKDARLKAAETALCALHNSRSIEISGAEAAVYAAGSQREGTLHDKVATLITQKYHDLAHQLPDTIVGRKIIAGFVMSQTLKSGEKALQVVCIGSGNRCVMGDKLSLQGQTVNDCHAEVIARRGLVRYFYRQLLAQGRDDCIFIRDEDKFTLKPGVEFHLYISTAPCGDSAIFAPSDATTDQPNQDRGDGDHHPLFENKKQGVLRTKVENGEGCIPIEEDTAAPTWDGILRGERLRTMSCSDKIAKWNFLGLQGTLLSHFLKPIKMSTLTLGMLYNHGHLTRAICCRVQKSMDALKKDLEPPTTHTVKHPGVSGQNQNRETGKIKTREFSLNWSIGDDRPEVLNGTEGRCEERFGSRDPPRICKAELYKEFKKLCDETKRAELCKDGYYKSKMCALDYLAAKNILWDALEKSGFGKWMSKPKEEKDF